MVTGAGSREVLIFNGGLCILVPFQLDPCTTRIKQKLIAWWARKIGSCQDELERY